MCSAVIVECFVLYPCGVGVFGMFAVNVRKMFCFHKIISPYVVSLCNFAYYVVA